MISGPSSIGSLRTGPAGQRRVTPVDAGAGARHEARQDGAAPGRALVPVAPAPETARSFVRLQTAAPYLTQLIVSNLGAGPSGERRSERHPELIALKARAAYRAADRLGSEIEPGFLRQLSV